MIYIIAYIISVIVNIILWIILFSKFYKIEKNIDGIILNIKEYFKKDFSLFLRAIILSFIPIINIAFFIFVFLNQKNIIYMIIYISDKTHTKEYAQKYKDLNHLI